jgi:hypothetical protein
MSAKPSLELNTEMSTNRSKRHFMQALAGISASSAFSLLLANSASSYTSITPALASTFKHRDEYYGVALLNTTGQIAQSFNLPDRGHDCIFSPNGKQLVVFARRPGTFMNVIDVAAKTLLHKKTAIEGRHFYGHGCFDAKGNLLYVTENDYARARGVIGIYDVHRDYQRVAEFDSYGIGPHDITRQVDDRVLIVANGGIETHPDTGRDKLNLYNMRSNLSVIDRHTGELLDQFKLPAELQKLSLRHMALDEHGNCYFAGQYEGAMDDQPPLLGKLSRNGKFRLWHTPREVRAKLKNYINSVCVVPGKPLMLASAARGNLTLLCNTNDGSIIQTFDINDGSGVAASHNKLYISDGYGHVNLFEGNDASWTQGSSHKTQNIHWDNHMASS